MDISVINFFWANKNFGICIVWFYDQSGISLVKDLQLFLKTGCFLSLLLKSLAHDFRVGLSSPDNMDIAPFYGTDLPEDVYYWSVHPAAHDLPKDKEGFLKKYHEDLFILAGYMSKMDQWIEHAYSGRMGREKLIYKGTASFVGHRRYRLAQTKKDNRWF